MARTFTPPGAQKAGKAVDLTLFDVEIKRLDSRIALKTLGLNDTLIGAFIAFCLLPDVFHIVQFLAEHLRNQLHPRKLFYDVFSHQLAVAQNCDFIAYLIYLIQEMGDKDDAHAPLS